MKTFSLLAIFVLASTKTLTRATNDASLRGTRQLAWDQLPPGCIGSTCKTSIKDDDTPIVITVINRYDNFTPPIQENIHDNDMPTQDGNTDKLNPNPTPIAPKQDKKDEPGDRPNDAASPDEQVTKPTPGHANEKREEKVDSALGTNGFVVGTWPPPYIQQDHRQESESSAEEPTTIAFDAHNAKERNEEPFTIEENEDSLINAGADNLSPTEQGRVPDTTSIARKTDGGKDEEDNVNEDKPFRTQGMQAFSDFLSCTVDHILSCVDCDRGSAGLFTQDCPRFYSWYLRNIQCCKNDECGESLETFREVHDCGMNLKENKKQEESVPSPFIPAAPTNEDSNNDSVTDTSLTAFTGLPCCCACRMLPCDCNCNSVEDSLIYDYIKKLKLNHLCEGPDCSRNENSSVQNDETEERSSAILCCCEECTSFPCDCSCNMFRR